MCKKILLSLLTVAVIVGGVAALSAYEAHVINVTAHIENALSVDPQEIAFGTVFPQEYLERAFTINLSDSFQSADRVDDVEYVIKQKPKCICDSLEYENPQLCPEGKYAPVGYATHVCSTGYHQMLLLCDYLSKLPQDGEATDVGEPSYYDKDTNTCPATRIPMIAHGRLAKSEQDFSDAWMVDLKVPPVTGYVAQDWPAGCPTVAEDSKDYGCDLWIEVTGISLPGDDIGCIDKASVMLTLDRSRSIDSGELAFLKTAANAFVDAMAPSTDGIHMGEVSFSYTASLDQILTDDGNAVKTAINNLASGGLTNLQDALLVSDAELEGINDRDDAVSPDYIVLITDGNPTACNGDCGSDYEGAGAAAAAAAKANGETIYVVGIGADVDADYLMNQIASSPSHYFGAANWEDLEDILEGIANCPQP